MEVIIMRGTRTKRVVEGRKFNGEFYESADIVSTKKKAQEKAKSIRNYGYRARVLPFVDIPGGRTEYVVYRSSTKERKARW
jgi:hypothetical protein